MSTRFRNTLSGALEEFKPATAGKVRMYHCGPTVYNYAHIGNLRAYVFADLLRRAFEYQGLEVLQVTNITDIGHLVSDADTGDDKMVKGLRREGLPLSLEGLKKLADKYEKAFKDDLVALNIKTPHHFPRATNYLREAIELIKKLEEKDFAYKVSDGIYFDTSRVEDYGKLGGLTPGKESATRVEASGKKNARDFVLWKLSRNSHLGFESPWGKGFPGWHIECSAMSRKLLGQPFDIHTGGVDHIPIHHNNEIAQSEAAFEKPLANFWLHNEFVTIADGATPPPAGGSGANKMAKSAGNEITLKTLAAKGYSPLAYRYFLLLAHYRTPVTFSWASLGAAQNAYHKLSNFVSNIAEPGLVDKAYQARFIEKINNDLNTAQALAVLWTLIKDKEVKPGDKRTTIMDFDKILGLSL